MKYKFQHEINFISSQQFIDFPRSDVWKYVPVAVIDVPDVACMKITSGVFPNKTLASI